MKYTLPILSIVLSVSINSRASDSSTYLTDTLPTTWELETEFLQTTPTDDRWWESFHDQTLQSLISKAVENNYDARAAQKRIEAAAQISRQTKAGYYPNLSATGGWSREQSAAAKLVGHSHPAAVSHFALGLSMNWEIDIFGRIQRQLKADKANYKVSVADYDATLVSLCSNLAKAYFELRMYQAEYEVAIKNATNSEELQKLAKARYEAGLRPFLDVVQAQINVAQTKATLPSLKASINTCLNELALLCGVYPDRLDFLRQSQALPSAPIPGGVGNPSDLLRRRPDIVVAEQQLAASAAQVGIAKADFLPVLSLSAEIGTQVHYLKDLFEDGSLYYSIMPTLSWTIFDGMARNAKVSEARYQMEAQIDEYNQTVMTAVQEVNNAMIQWKAQSEELVYQQIILNDAKQQLEIQIDRYTQGLAPFSDVTGAQTTVLQYENAVIEAKASQLASLVTLYTALGGGY